MSGLELYKEINQTINILIWPSVVIIALVLFRRQLSQLISRFKDVEGKVGTVTFKLGLEKVIHETVNRAVELENVGKSEEAKQVVSEAGQLISDLYYLTPSDIDYLLDLAGGRSPKRRWGTVHLVRLGLVDFDGGQLTEKGRGLIENYQRISKLSETG